LFLERLLRRAFVTLSVLRYSGGKLNFPFRSYSRSALILDALSRRHALQPTNAAQATDSGAVVAIPIADLAITKGSTGKKVIISEYVPVLMPPVLLRSQSTN